MRRVMVSDYAREIGVSDQTVREMVNRKELVAERVSPRKTFVLIREPGDEEAVVDQPEKAIKQAVEESTELTGLSNEEKNLAHEEKVLDTKKRIAEKRLKLDAGISWDDFQQRQAKLDEDREALQDRERVVSALERDQAALENERTALSSDQSAMVAWFDRAKDLTGHLVDILTEVNADSKYDKSQAQDYEPVGKTPPKKILLAGQALREKWEEVGGILLKLVMLPEPYFITGISDTEDDDELFGDEGEPEEAEDEQVE